MHEETGIAAQIEKCQPETQSKNDNYRPINCDQVSWMLSAIGRLVGNDNVNPRVSRQREMMKFACLYEIMEVAQLKFADKSARWNGTPNDARDYENK